MSNLHDLNDDVAYVLLTEEQLHEKVKELGAAISADYAGKPLLVVGILKGSVVFMADLIRSLTCDVSLDFMAVSSYGSGTSTSGRVRVLKDLNHSIENVNVLVVEDILDSGVTLSYLKAMLQTRNPASIRLCTLLDKPERRKTDVVADYVGFTVPDAFVVGYGLDYDEKYRQLPYVGVLKPEVYGG